MYVLFVAQCYIQGHSKIYRIADMLKVLVIPCDIQLPTCISIPEVERICQDLHASDSFHSTRPDSVVLQ